MYGRVPEVFSQTVECLFQFRTSIFGEAGQEIVDVVEVSWSQTDRLPASHRSEYGFKASNHVAGAKQQHRI
jgi:hypothetical protein